MRAILIDPSAKTITEVVYTGDYQNIYTHIGAYSFDIVHLNNKGDTVFVDDEGLINGKVHIGGMFRYAGDNPAYLAGKGLILGTDAERESVATNMTLDEVRLHVEWGKPRMIGGRALFYGDSGTAWYMDL